MKKPNIPETSGRPIPEFVRAVKDNLEIITGRRRNRLDLPDIQTLTFSAAPTQAELQAFNNYVNEWGKAMVALMARLDE